jgi:two-component system response regulator FixJ
MISSDKNENCQMAELIHVVDDDELVRASLSYILSNHGYSTQIYSGGAELFQESRLDRGSILLDICMPGMSGLEVLMELARRGCTLPVVAMSARGDIPAAVHAMKLGAIDFIAKPLNERDLLQAVFRASESSGQADTRRQVEVAAAARVDRLTPRQRQILQGLLDGLSNKGIAGRLGICSRTIEMHRACMKVTLGIKSVSETVRLAIDANMVPTKAGGMWDASAAAASSCAIDAMI